MRMTINNHIFGEDAWALGLVLLRLDRSWLELLVVFNAEHGQQGPVANKSVSLRGSPQAATLPGFVCLFFNSILFYFLKIIYLLIFRQRGREGEKHPCMVASGVPLTGDPARVAQACALTGNPNSGPFVLRAAFNPLSHTSQG